MKIIEILKENTDDELFGSSSGPVLSVIMDFLDDVQRAFDEEAELGDSEDLEDLDYELTQARTMAELAEEDPFEAVSTIKHYADRGENWAETLLGRINNYKSVKIG